MQSRSVARHSGVSRKVALVRFWAGILRLLVRTSQVVDSVVPTLVHSDPQPVSTIEKRGWQGCVVVCGGVLVFGCLWSAVEFLYVQTSVILQLHIYIHTIIHSLYRNFRVCMYSLSYVS